MKPAWEAATARENNLRGWRLSGISPFSQAPLWRARALAKQRGDAASAAFGVDGQQVMTGIIVLLA